MVDGVRLAVSREGRGAAIKRTMFTKDLAIAGGLLILAANRFAAAQ